jgi:transposase, IS6 family
VLQTAPGLLVGLYREPGPICPIPGGRHFADVIIILCVRWYLRYSLSYRDLEEIMAGRGLAVDHVTIWRWVQHYAPRLNQRLRRELRRPNVSWRWMRPILRLPMGWVYGSG